MLSRRCLIELDTAITFGVPIVALNCVGKEYNFVEAADFMLHLETSLDADAIEVLTANDVDPLRLAHKLSCVVPNIISIAFNTSASDNAMKAAMADLVKAITSAAPLPIEKDFKAWLAGRAARDKAVLEQALDSSTIRGTQRGRMLQKIERAEELADELQESRADAKRKDALVDKLMNRIEKLEAKLGI